MVTKQEILSQLQNSYDIISRDFLIAKKFNATIIMLDGMTNKESINRFVLEELQHADIKSINLNNITSTILSDGEVSIAKTAEDCLKGILNGDAILLCAGLDSAIQIGAKGYATRGISEPPTSIAIKGPREGFTEDMKKNSIMLRRKLKTKDLVLSIQKIGKYSGTNVLLCYIEGIADKTLVSKIKNRLEAIDIDGILDSSYIADLLDEKKHSIFKQVGTTEKPDIMAAKLLEGRIGIIVDGSPIALTLPFMLLEDYQSPEDYYEKPQRATFSRIIRLVAILTCVLLPAIYVSAQVFHIQLLPLRLLTKIMGSVREIPLPPAIEMFAVLLIFEILRESSVRMPKYVGNALAIVGGLVLGDTAVKAGIISSPSILIIAISSISLYTVPDQEGALTLLRVVFLAIGSTLGIFGIITAAAVLAIYLVSLSSFGTPYLAPFAPKISPDLKDGIFKSGLTGMKTRPYGISTNNHTRLKRQDYDGKAD